MAVVIVVAPALAILTCRIGACDAGHRQRGGGGDSSSLRFYRVAVCGHFGQRKQWQRPFRSQNRTRRWSMWVLGVDMLFARLAPLAAALVLAGM